MKKLLLVLLLFIPLQVKADSTICALNPAAPLTGSECVPIMQSGKTVKTTPLNIANLLAAGVSSLSLGTTGLTPNTPTTGAIVVDGILNADHGGVGTTGKFIAVTTASYGMSSLGGL